MLQVDLWVTRAGLQMTRVEEPAGVGWVDRKSCNSLRVAGRYNKNLLRVRVGQVSRIAFGSHLCYRLFESRASLLGAAQIMKRVSLVIV